MKVMRNNTLRPSGMFSDPLETVSGRRDVSERALLAPVPWGAPCSDMPGVLPNKVATEIRKPKAK